MRFILIPEWRKAWKMYSVIAMAVSGAIQATLLGMLTLSSQIPKPALLGLSILVLALGIFGRLVKQVLDETESLPKEPQ